MAPKDEVAAAVTFAGHEIVGCWRSWTVTVNEHCDVFPCASCAVHVTVVTPTGNDVPDGGAHASVTPAQLSDALAMKFTAATHEPAGVCATTFDGQAIDGSWVSLTVTVKLQLGPALAVHVTVVTPTAKNEPDAGAHVTV